MAQLAKVETKVPLKGSSDQFFTFFRNNIPNLHQMFPQNVQSVEVVGGGEVKTGSVLHAKYSLAGSPVMSAKIKIEALDDARKSMSVVVLEGDLFQLYKTFKVKMEVSAGQAKWSIEFEKANENAPHPSPYLDLITKVCKGLDAHLSV
ncbi:hypothetical protein Tsubulata_003726 [Turnera subulata]|uniref:Bet v I/Major latex protein domain-containing protein n=1 Tax=Turnera subulata TaxID=218843 RepID=A0A9Q0GDR1_9ROSI|nr:hypothetical protein Tsubulata_003726 [Turnera subulata]